MNLNLIYELTKKNIKIDIADDIKEAIQVAKGPNNKIQLLSLMCRKPEKNVTAH